MREVLPGSQLRHPHEPTDEANRCSLGHETPKRLQKALYVGFSQIGRPLQVVIVVLRHVRRQTFGNASKLQERFA
jgi:hypothetical protein